MKQASATKATGLRAAAVKYDILTALLVLGAQDAGTDGRLAGRLALLITARFNWQRESFASGTREIARLWGVTERTAKRELAAMRLRGWITIRRAPAKGRVTEHGVDLAQVLAATRGYWAAVGPDFVARMGRGPDETLPEEGLPGAADNVVPFSRGTGQGAPIGDGTLWAAASRLIWESDATLHAAWFARLVETERSATMVELCAPSAFAARYIQTHFAGRLLAAVSSFDPGITEVRVTP
jgi:DNA-binding MarR family transcriptional regulator